MYILDRMDICMLYLAAPCCQAVLSIRELGALHHTTLVCVGSGSPESHDNTKQGTDGGSSVLGADVSFGLSTHYVLFDVFYSAALSLSILDLYS